MINRPLVRPLLFLGIVVALTTHLWMLNDPMPAQGPAVDVAGEAAVPVGAMEPAPAPADGEPDWGMSFMALTCLAVLMGVVATPRLATAASRLPGAPRSTTLPLGLLRLIRTLRWPPPPTAASSRVDGGILLRV